MLVAIVSLAALFLILFITGVLIGMYVELRRVRRHRILARAKAVRLVRGPDQHAGY